MRMRVQLVVFTPDKQGATGRGFRWSRFGGKYQSGANPMNLAPGFPILIYERLVVMFQMETNLNPSYVLRDQVYKGWHFRLWKRR